MVGSFRKSWSGVSIHCPADRAASTTSPRESGEGPSREGRLSVAADPVWEGAGVGSAGTEGSGASETAGADPSLAEGRTSTSVSLCSSDSGVSSSEVLGVSEGDSDAESVESADSGAVGWAVAPTWPSVTAGVPPLSHISGVADTATSSSSAFSALTISDAGSRRKVRWAEWRPYTSCCT